MFLAWAPWMDDKVVHDKVFEERARIDGTIDKQTGELICDYKVTWFPFGRWVELCEAYVIILVLYENKPTFRFIETIQNALYKSITLTTNALPLTCFNAFLT